MTSVSISGIQPESVLDVSTGSNSGDQLDEASIVVRDTATNRQFRPGDDVEIDFGTGLKWTGSVSGRPAVSNGRLTYKALGKLLPLKHEQAFRVFYQEDSATVVEKLATEQTEQLPKVLVHTGDDPSQWRSRAPVAEPYKGGRAGLYDFGSDMLFLGARAGRHAEIQTTFENVQSGAIADGFFELKTRLITSDISGLWSLVVELRTSSGESYRWTPTLRSGEHTYELAAEDATPTDSGLNDGELRYRFVPSGTTAEPFGVFLDHAATIPFRTEQRPNAPTVDAENSRRTITRRVDGSVGRTIADIATEDSATWYLDDGTLVYRPGGSAESASLSIRQGEDPITNVDTDADYESIRNEVVVQGQDNIEVVVRDQASIDFYGPTPRPEPIVDPSLTSEADAERRGEGFLEDRAWNDAEITFTLADLSYVQLTTDTDVTVNYPPRGLDGTYTVADVDAKSNGEVDVTIVASTGRK